MDTIFFQDLVIMNSASNKYELVVYVPLNGALYLLGEYSGVEWLGHRTIVFLIMGGSLHTVFHSGYAEIYSPTVDTASHFSQPHHQYMFLLTIFLSENS